MGYHIITHMNQNGLKHFYFESLDEIVFKKDQIPNNAVVYEADKQWQPFLLSDHPDLNALTDDNKLVGRRAELKFEKLAFENKFVVKQIDQTRKSYYQYKTIVGHVKRSDYLIMNLPNVEVDVKCLSRHNIMGKNYYLLSQDDVEKHKVILQQVKRRMVFAIFQRGGNWYKNDSLHMIDLIDVEQCDTTKLNEKIFYMISDENLLPGFALLEHIRAVTPVPVSYKIKEPEIQASKIKRRWMPRLFLNKHLLIVVMLIFVIVWKRQDILPYQKIILEKIESWYGIAFVVCMLSFFSKRKKLKKY